MDPGGRPNLKILATLAFQHPGSLVGLEDRYSQWDRPIPEDRENLPPSHLEDLGDPLTRRRHSPLAHPVLPAHLENLGGRPHRLHLEVLGHLEGRSLALEGLATLGGLGHRGCPQRLVTRSGPLLLGTLATPEHPGNLMVQNSPIAPGCLDVPAHLGNLGLLAHRQDPRIRSDLGSPAILEHQPDRSNPRRPEVLVDRSHLGDQSPLELPAPLGHHSDLSAREHLGALEPLRFLPFLGGLVHPGVLAPQCCWRDSTPRASFPLRTSGGRAPR